MASVFGEKLKISIFGQSHSEAIGVCIDGFPAGFRIDMESFRPSFHAEPPEAERTQRHERKQTFRGLFRELLTV